MIDIEKILKGLADERPIFHSEADFQHALAWKIHEEHQEALIRLEFPYSQEKKGDENGKIMALDIFVEYNGESMALELKYKTEELEVTINGNKEVFSLKKQMANDQGRYDFCKDIERLERFVDNNSKHGYAIFLTNDNKYWENKRPQKKTIDEAFKIYEGRVLPGQDAVKGKLNWDEKASDSTKKGRESPIELKHTYDVKWSDYPQPPGLSKNGKFRFLKIEVKAR